MSESGYQRVCALLAVAEVRMSDVLDFYRTMHKRGPEVVQQDMMRLQRTLSVNNERGGEMVRIGSSASDEVAEKVQRLLFEEAHLSKTHAIELLSSEVRRRYPSVEIPSDPKKGFASWIRRLAGAVPESEVLHLATAIRNSRVHDLPQDWRLK